jgi:hypothetical protein
MNGLMGMKKNDDIVDARLASIDEVEAYQDRTGPGPVITSTIRPYLDNVLAEWNTKLASKFVRYYAKHHNINQLSKKSELGIENAFLRRLETLRKEYNRLVDKTEEERQSMKNRAMQKQRPSSRRQTVCD